MHTYTHTLPSLQFWIDSLYVDVVTSVYPAQSMLPYASFVVLPAHPTLATLGPDLGSRIDCRASLPRVFNARCGMLLCQLYLFLLYVCY